MSIRHTGSKDQPLLGEIKRMELFNKVNYEIPYIKILRKLSKD